MVTFLGRKYKPPLPMLPLKAPNTIMPGCITFLTIYFGSYRDAVLGQRTIFKPLLTSLKELSSLYITFFHCSDVQLSYLLQKASLFIFIAAVSMGFSAAWQLGRPRSFSRRWQIILVAKFWRSSRYAFLSSVTALQASGTYQFLVLSF